MPGFVPASMQNSTDFNECMGDFVMNGTRGPLPKPNILKAIEGNPGKRVLNLSDGINPRGNYSGY